ncbi:hypothetical protein [Hyphobacterium marinum]|uniref:Uncharacterized protein n=1 Tax=Hyphobacterium marinum TaxID=3116574 RepID=A0ABU7LXM7_9PROT|nr:hypothetical protein [Hyphobacterium sp. Y6023]MEE2566301.1 hypothetical protein [Hyphobacterium sp. Y6023]
MPLIALFAGLLLGLPDAGDDRECRVMTAVTTNGERLDDFLGQTATLRQAGEVEYPRGTYIQYALSGEVLRPLTAEGTVRFTAPFCEMSPGEGSACLLYDETDSVRAYFNETDSIEYRSEGVILSFGCPPRDTGVTPR